MRPNILHSIEEGLVYLGSLWEVLLQNHLIIRDLVPVDIFAYLLPCGFDLLSNGNFLGFLVVVTGKGLLVTLAGRVRKISYLFWDERKRGTAKVLWIC